MGSVLFVCKANVCRSPVMEFVFSAALRQSYSVSVSSAGTHCVAEEHICAVGRRLLSSRQGGAAFAEEHRPEAVDDELLAAQDLILVASREERAELARMSPAQRARVFTVREALALSRADLSASDRRWLEGVGQRSPWTRYAALLDRRRGTVNLEDIRGRWPWSKPRDQMDVPDVHQRGQRAHRAAITRLIDMMDDFADRTATLVDGVSSAAGR